MDWADFRATLAGFAAALAVLAALIYFVGADRIGAVLSRTDPAVVGLIGLVSVAWLFVWGQALRTVLGVLGIPLGRVTAFFVFAAVTFANNTTPFGQAGGEPISALFISRVTDSEYETSLAAIASVDALHFVPSLGLGLIGVGYYAVTITLPDRLEVAAAVVAGLALSIPLAAAWGWRNRYRLERIAVRTLTPPIRALGRLIPRRSPPSPDALERRIEGFFGTIERIATDRRGLLLGLVFSALGWIALATSLWLSLYAVGYVVPVAAPLVAVPLAGVASVTPLPGGLGGIEAVLVALLVPTTGLSLPAAGAAVLLYRVATYWFSLALGGATAAALSAS